MRDIIEKYRQSVIQIATPFNTGTGFCVPEAGVIVTNNHVVEGNREVVIEGTVLPRQRASVLFSDPKLDLAFLALPSAAASFHPIPMDPAGEVATGDRVVALGHPFGLKFTATQGIVSSVSFRANDIAYFQHDAALNPGNSGGPLIDEQGKLVGVNTYTIQDGENMGICLPAKYLRATLDLYSPFRFRMATKCAACAKIVTAENQDDGYCPNCGSVIELPNQVEEYQPTGINRTIEQLIAACGFDVLLSRRGPSIWEMHHGSAKILLSYYEPNGLLAGDAVLCEIPQDVEVGQIFEYLLRQNYEMESLSFSVRGAEIVLSLVIQDRFLSLETGQKMFHDLFERADHYDNILVEKFGAAWKMGEVS